MNRDANIQFRVTKTEMDELRKKAHKEDLSLSAYVRMILFNYYKLMERKKDESTTQNDNSNK